MALLPSVLALAIGMALPTAHAAVTAEVSINGSESQWWNTYQVTLTNDGSKPIELKNSKVVFDSNLSMSVPSWSAQGISYPGMKFSSNAQGDVFSNTLALTFDDGSWIKSQLHAGESIALTLGVSGVLDLALLQESIRLIADDEGEVGDPELTLQLASPVSGAEFEEGQSVAMLANVKAINTSIKSVTFYVDGEQISSLNQAPFQASWIAAGEGSRVIKVVAEDESGLTQEQAVTILVKAEEVEPPVEPEIPVAPVVELTNPRNGQTVFVGKVTTITANASDENNDLEAVEFFVNGASIGRITQAPYHVTWQPSELGHYMIEAVAYDASGHQTRTREIIVSAEELGTGGLSCDIKQIYREDGTECMGDDHPRRIIGYYTSWRTGKNGLPAYLADDLPWEKLTHINYAFASINKDDYSMQVDDSATKMTWEGVPGAEMDPSLPYQGHFNLLSKFKKQYPDVKTLISVGGWAETGGFYPMTTDLASCSVNMEGIKAFNKSAVEFIRKYDFDGVDIDYEYPSSMKDSGNPIDFEVSNKCRGQLWDNYMVQMTDLRKQLDEAGERDGRRYMLTIAAPSSGYLLRGMQDFAMQDVLDFVNIMSYDLHGTWNEFVGPQAALFDDGKDAELAKWGVYSTEQYQGIGYLNQAWTHHFFRGAFKPSQINMGIPYYTRGWQGVSGGDKGLWGRAVEPNQSTCPEGTTVCGWGAEGTDNIWHDVDANGNEIKAGVAPMWHAMNLMHAQELGIDGMPSYGPDWGMDPNEPKDLIEGEYERVWSEELQTAWLWNETKKVFLSIEDKDSLKPKLDYIVDNGLGGMLIWEMAGDYSYDAVKREYVMGTDMTSYAHEVFAAADPMDIRHNDLPEPDSVIDVTVSTTDWPEGDSNYPINPTLVFKNNSEVAIPGGATIEFLMPTSTGDLVKDWSGAGLKVVESGHTGTNFAVNGEKKLFHKVALTLRATESIPADGEYSIAMVYYTPVSGVANGVRFIVGKETVGLKKDFPLLPDFEGATDGDNGGEGGIGQSCTDAGINPEGMKVYPEFPRGDHAAGGDQLIHSGSVWQANWWTNTVPSSSDSSWKAVCKI